MAEQLASDGHTGLWVSVVIPVLNEAPTIASLIARIGEGFDSELRGVKHSFVIVDDGSTDSTSDVLKEIASSAEHDLTVVSFRRNFGKEAAMLAGLESAVAQACTHVALVDGDGQHPVDDLLQMLKISIDKGRSVVGVQDYSSSSILYRFGTVVLRGAIKGRNASDAPAGVSDFRVLTREAATEYLGLQERERYLRDLFEFNGSPYEYFRYSVGRRADSSKSRWTRLRLVSYAATLVSSRGALILPRLMVFTGTLVSFVSLYAFATTVLSLVRGDRTGVPSILFTLVLFQLGTIMLLFFIAAIVVTILVEVKQRPPYVVGEVFKSRAGDRT